MIRLKDVSTIDLCDPKQFYINTEAISDYQQLKDFVTESQFKAKDLDDILTKTEQAIAKANDRCIPCQIYSFSDYEGSIINRSILDEIDKNVSGDNLVYKNPLTATSIKTKRLSRLNIYQIKHLLGHVVINRTSMVSQNALIHKLRNFGETDIKKIVFALDFYEQQIMRLAKETDLDEFVFFLNQDKKIKLIEEQLEKIVEYLVNNATETIWGNISVSQKEMLLSFFTSKSKQSLMAKQGFLEVLANYTTVNELESDIVKTKVIDRFIVK